MAFHAGKPALPHQLLFVLEMHAHVLVQAHRKQPYVGFALRLHELARQFEKLAVQRVRFGIANLVGIHPGNSHSTLHTVR